MPHAVVRWQIVTPDAETVAEFYRKLFGWSVGDANPFGYRDVATDAGRGIDGGIFPAPPQAHTFVQLFIEVEAVDDAIRRAQELGATVIIPPTPLPDCDTIAVLRDPTGLPFGLVTARS